MLKNLGYAGVYHDKNISVSLLLENPLEHNLEATVLVFSVALRTKNSDTDMILDDFTFYIMDETNRLYNTQSMPYLKPAIEIKDDDEPIRYPVGLIHTEFKHEFLFQELRVAFYYQPYEKINIIKLQH